MKQHKELWNSLRRPILAVEQEILPERQVEIIIGVAEPAAMQEPVEAAEPAAIQEPVEAAKPVEPGRPAEDRPAAELEKLAEEKPAVELMNSVCKKKSGV